MDKAPDAFRTISEVSEWLDTPTYVLRFWESRFAQIKPAKRAGGRRYYRPEDMMLLGGIKKLLHFDGNTIKGVQNLIKEKGVKHVAAFSPGLDEQIVSPAAKDEAPKIDLDSLTKEPDTEETPKEKATPLQLKEDSKEAVEETDKQKQGARAVKITVHKKAKVKTEATVSAVPVPESTPAPIPVPIPVIEIPKDKLLAGPFRVGTARSYSAQDFQEIETLYYSLKMVRNNMKRAHAAR